MTPSLEDYRGKRDPAATPEPLPAGDPVRHGGEDTFVVQEHHARSLHWDLRLERAGVLVSWAVPKGLPLEPRTNHLAVQTEDHPLDYAGFAGDIPAGQYGGGRVSIWDRGTYQTEKWTEAEVKVHLHGQRVSGRYVLFRTDGRQWLVHRSDPPPDPGWQPPRAPAPMLAATGVLPPPTEDARWGYEFKWDGVRAVVAVDGGRPKALGRSGREVTASYPELRALAASLGSRQLVLDGELVAFDPAGRPSFEALQARMHLTRPEQVRRVARQVPVTYLVFDLLHLDGHETHQLPYLERRTLLDSLALAGPSWQVPPSFRGGGADVVAAARGQGLEGVVAKRLDSPYLPGRRSEYWRKVKNQRTQDVVVGGWRPGAGRRANQFGSLLLGVPEENGLAYCGHVGSGFTERALAELSDRLRPLRRRGSPFSAELPRADAKDAVWVRPELVGEVAFSEWTRDGRLRHPVWRGLRADLEPARVRRGG